MKNINKTLLLILLINVIISIALIQIVPINDFVERDLLRSLNIHEGKFPLVGPEMNYGGYIGPLAYYIFSVPLAISGNIYFLMTFMLVINLITISMLFHFCDTYFNRPAAVTASVLFAVSPFLNLFLIMPFHVSFIPLFSIISLYALFRIIIDKNQIHLITLIASLAALLQFNFSTMSMIAVAILSFILFFRQNLNYRFLIYGILAALIILSPLIYYDVSTDFSNSKAIITTFTKNALGYSGYHIVTDTGLVPDFKNIDNRTTSSPIQVLHETIKILHIERFDAIAENGLRMPVILNVFNYLAYLLFFAAIIFLIFNVYQKPQNSTKYSILLLYFFIPLVILFFFRLLTIRWRYAMIVYISLFTITGIGAAHLYKKPNLKYLAYTFIALIILSQLVFLGLFISKASSTGLINPYDFDTKIMTTQEKIAISKYLSSRGLEVSNMAERMEFVLKNPQTDTISSSIGGFRYLMSDAIVSNKTNNCFKLIHSSKDITYSSYSSHRIKDFLVFESYEERNDCPHNFKNEYILPIPYLTFENGNTKTILE